MKKSISLTSGLLLLTLLVGTLPAHAAVGAGGESGQLSVVSEKATALGVDLVRAKNRRTVYVVEKGRRVAISSKTLRELGLSYRDARQVSFRELLRLRRTTFVRSAETEQLYLIQSAQKVAIDQGYLEADQRHSEKDVVTLPEVQLKTYKEEAYTIQQSRKLPKLYLPEGGVLELELGTDHLSNGDLHLNSEGALAFEGHLWSNGSSRAYSTDSNYYYVPFDVNSKGQVVGVVGGREGDTPNRPFLWDDGKITLIGGRGFEGTATSINDLGQVVGDQVLRGGAESASFLWYDGAFHNDELPNKGKNISVFRINNKGQMIGTMPSKPDSAYDIGFLFDHGTLTVLPTFGGARNTPLEINEQGQVVGFAEEPAEPDNAFPSATYLWQDGVMKKLWEGAENLSLNNKGQVVGSGLVEDKAFYPRMRPLLWDGEKVVQIEKLLPENLDWQTYEWGPFSYTVQSINDEGYIMGVANKKDYTPLPFLFKLPATISQQQLDQWIAPWEREQEDIDLQQ